MIAFQKARERNNKLNIEMPKRLILNVKYNAYVNYINWLNFNLPCFYSI